MDATESTRRNPSLGERQRAVFGVLAFCILVIALTLYQVQAVGAVSGPTKMVNTFLERLSGYSGSFIFYKELDLYYSQSTIGSVMTYTLFIRNTEPTSGTSMVNTSVSDPLPAGVEYVAGSITTTSNLTAPLSYATYDSGTNSVVWTGTVRGNERVRVIYNVDVTTLKGTIFNTALLNHSTLASTMEATATTRVTSDYLLYTSDDNPGVCSTTFTDISGSGTDLGLTTGGAVSVTMPFNFIFYRSSSADLAVGNSGGIRFGRTSGPVNNYDRFWPSQQGSGAPSMGIYPFSEYLGADTGGVYYQTLGTAPDRRFVVQWDRELYDGSHNNEGNEISFQVILHEGNNYIDFVYADVVVTGTRYYHDSGAEAGVGLKGSDISLIQYWSYEYADRGYPGPRLHDGLALCFRPLDYVLLPLTTRDY